MAVTFHRRGRRAALTALCLVAGLLVTPASPHHVTASVGDGASWIQVGGDIDGAYADSFGRSVAMSRDGSTVIIGAYLNDGNGQDAGLARVYRRDGTAWVQVGGDIDGEAAGDNSGRSVAMSGDGSTIVIGAPLSDRNGENAGNARVYRLDGTTWVQVGGTIDGETAGGWFGASLAVSGDGNTVIIGAPLSGPGSGTGRTAVFRFDGTVWVQVGDTIDAEAVDDHSGQSVAMNSDGTAIIVGAWQNDANGQNSGHARVYRIEDGGWTQVGVDIDGETEGDHSGYSVAMNGDGTAVIVGAWENDGNRDGSGHARVYRFDGTAWAQVGDDIDGEAEGDRSSGSVAMSGDGTIVTIGAQNNDGNGHNSGHVRVYRFEAGDWVQVGADIDGRSANVLSGGSVAMSGDGSTILIGASGHARVFEIDEPNESLAIAYVAGNLRPPLGDRPNVAHLEAGGATVTIIDDDQAKTTDYSGFDLVFLSTSVTLSKIGDHFRTMAIPMVTNEQHLLDDNAMGAKPIGQKTSRIRIVAPGNDLAASLTGDVVITTADTPIGFATPGPGAEVVAVFKHFRKKAVHFSYRTGAEMIGGYTAPARRVYFPGTYQTPLDAKAKYFQLLDATIAWAACVS